MRTRRLPPRVRRFLRRRFAKVPAGTRRRPWPAREDLTDRDDPDHGDGGAAVREPRRPSPGPRAGAGAAPIPDPPQTITLGDSRA